MSQKIRIGDLVWSEYYSRLGVVSRIITDVSGYTEAFPGYDLVDPATRTQLVVGGVREHMVIRSKVHCNLVKLADGYQSAAAREQDALHASQAYEEIGD